ncbi:MAG: Gfo/Idh/MocA family oxidoreductase [Spirochaetales bacterium]|nr:Gfo/Idh/MocA family oxidoreductase [Spirochaetales bacterium]MCF7937849.1 Gfo/Idh/MocA family oxidoreductase [Spirochaetales bacterium]
MSLGNTRKELLRCGIVGLGRIGSLLEKDKLREKPCSHAGAIHRNRQTELSAGCDIDKDRRDLFQRQWKCGSLYHDYNDFFSETDLDLVTIATPPETHLPILEAAAGAGIKTAVCEKPLAGTLEDAKRIVALHNSGRVRILVNHERRYSADYQLVRRRIRESVYGELRSVHAKIYMGNTRSRSEVAFWDGTHLLDIINFLIDGSLQIRHVRASEDKDRSNFLVAAEVSGNERLDGVPVLVEIGTRRNYIHFEVDCFFEKGRVIVGNGIYREYESRKSPYYEGMRSLVLVKRKLRGKTGYFSNMFQDAVLLAQGKTGSPVSSARDGYIAQEMIERVIEESE